MSYYIIDELVYGKAVDFKKIPFRVINYILEYIRTKVGEMSDLFYYFKLDRFKKIFNYRSIRLINLDIVLLSDSLDTCKIQHMRNTTELFAELIRFILVSEIRLYYIKIPYNLSSFRLIFDGVKNLNKNKKKKNI
jgi:hypothetical protein